jgi:hypothetical protein
MRSVGDGDLKKGLNLLVWNSHDWWTEQDNIENFQSNVWGTNLGRYVLDNLFDSDSEGFVLGC